MRDIAEAGVSPLVQLIEENASGTQNVLEIRNDGTGAGLDIFAKIGAYITQNISNGYAMYVVRDLNEAGASPLVRFTEEHTSGTQNVLEIRNDGTGKGLYINGLGGGGIGIDVDADIAGFAAEFFNDGDNVNRSGIVIANGADNNAGENVHIMFRDGNHDAVGRIYSTAGTVNYEAFTGGHLGSTKENKEYPYGTVMLKIETKPNPLKKHFRQSKYIVEPSKKEYDKRVFGIYAGRDTNKENEHSIYGLGDGHILVCKEGGNIEDGDYLASSNKEGHAMKQNDDVLHNYTIAKALENVNWKKEKKTTKLIAVTYHAS